MNEQSLSEQSDNADEVFAAMAKAVAEGNTEEINRLMNSEAPLVEAPEQDEEEVVEETPEETPAEAEEAPVEEEPAEIESEQPPTETDKNEAASAASNPTKDDEIAELKRELHSLRSDAGRMRHVQSRMHQLENELRAYRKDGARTPDQTEKQAAKKELPAKLADRLKALKEIDPDLADTFETLAEMVQTTREEAEQTVHSKLAEKEETEYLTEQWNILTTQIPQAPQIFQSNQWKEWKDTLTPGQRAMAESSVAVDVARAIHAFAADMKKLHGGASQSETSSEGGDPTKTSVTAQVPAKTEVTEARNRKLQTTAAVKTPAAKAVQELDAEAYFTEMYKNLAKKNHIK